jgi:hypothetical protein
MKRDNLSAGGGTAGEEGLGEAAGGDGTAEAELEAAELTRYTADDEDDKDDTGAGVSAAVLLIGLSADGVVCGFIHFHVFFDFDSLGPGGGCVNGFPAYGRPV